MLNRNAAQEDGIPIWPFAGNARYLWVGHFIGDNGATTENPKVEPISRKGFFNEKNPQRLYARPRKRKIQSEHGSDAMRSAEMPDPGP